MLNNPNEWHNIEEEVEGDVNENITEDDAIAPQEPSKNNNIKFIKLGLLILAVLFIGVLAITKKIQSNKAQTDVSIQDPNQMAQTFYDKASGSANGEPTAVVNVDLGDGTTPPASTTTNVPVTAIPPLAAQGGNGDLVIAQKEITPTDKYNYNKAIASPIANKETVIVSVGNEGRQNPFLPFKEKKIASSGGYSGYSNPSFDIIEPPTSILPDPQAVQLMETTISGIMYDYKNPSAIVNIDGQDQLVRKHDKLNGFTILDITRDKVVVKSGMNIYRASVGQSITTEDLNINDIPNLKHKFAGAYKPVSRNSIEIKSN